MTKLKRVLAPEDGTSFDEICSFYTKNYVGIFVSDSEGFMIVPRKEYEFSFDWARLPDTLEELDELVYKTVIEHIEEVSTSRVLCISIDEDKE